MYFSGVVAAVDRVQLFRLAIYIISFDKLVNTIVGTALGQMLLLVLREQGVETVNIAVHVRRPVLSLLVGWPDVSSFVPFFCATNRSHVM